MWVPNIGPELPESSFPQVHEGPRRGNVALVHRNDTLMHDVEAASIRASMITHRFGGVRHALTRPVTSKPGKATDKPDKGSAGEPDAVA